MTKKISTGLIIYWIACLAFIFSMVGYMLYKEAAIFPPTRPANLEELATWNKNDLWRLMEYYSCNDLPMGGAPSDLKQLETFCNTVSGHWSKKYKESKYEDARGGADKLRQE